MSQLTMDEIHKRLEQQRAELEQQKAAIEELLAEVIAWKANLSTLLSSEIVELIQELGTDIHSTSHHDGL